MTRSGKPSPGGAGWNGKGSSTEWRRLRAIVLANNKLHNGGLCVLCGTEPATVAGHIVAKAHGGTDDLANLRAECRTCSSKAYITRPCPRCGYIEGRGDGSASPATRW